MAQHSPLSSPHGPIMMQVVEGGPKMIFKYRYNTIHRIEISAVYPPSFEMFQTEKVKVCVKSSF